MPVAIFLHVGGRTDHCRKADLAAGMNRGARRSGDEPLPDARPVIPASLHSLEPYARCRAFVRITPNAACACG